MRLALKVVLATVLGVLLVLVVFGYANARQEVALFDADMRNDHRLVGRTLAGSVASVWRALGPEQAVALVARADEDRPALQMAWIYADGRSDLAQTFSKRSVMTLTVPTHDVVRGVDPANLESEFLVTLIPVRDGPKLLGAIEIAESLGMREEFVKQALFNAFLASIVMVAISGIVVLVLGVWLVGRPLDRLAEKARRVGAGDLEAPLDLTQRDEIGQLAREMNAMCDRLAEANLRTEAETAAKIQALEQLRHGDRLITVGRLAAGIAHELGTPLNVILGRAKLMKKGLGEQDSRGTHLETISQQADRMSLIIRQLLDFARRREPKTSPTDLGAVVGAVTQLVQPLAHRQGVDVRVTEVESVRTLGDSMRLEQVLSNLVVNAVHACVSGGHVAISVGSEKRARPGEPAETLRDFAVMRVADDGHGMSDETRARIFEPFFTTKQTGQGTGLGLSVAHGIVEEHGGFILVETELGQGSTFSVYLPTAS